jgi:hypothetical protein
MLNGMHVHGALAAASTAYAVKNVGLGLREKHAWFMHDNE